MKIPVNLQELLAQNSEAIAPVKALIAQEMVIIDGTGIDSFDAEQLEQILGDVCKTWDFNKLKTIFNLEASAIYKIKPLKSVVRTQYLAVNLLLISIILLGF